MSELMATFADVEFVVMVVLEELRWGGQPIPTVTATPSKFAPPLIMVRRIGGSDNGITDFPRVQVHVIGSNRDMAVTIGENARQLMLAARRTAVLLDDGRRALIDRVETSTPAEEVAEENFDYRRTVGTYDLALRRPISG